MKIFFYTMIISLIITTQLMQANAGQIINNSIPQKSSLQSNDNEIVIPHVCEYINDMRMFYIDASTRRINNLILVGNNNPEFCRKIKFGNLYKISYVNLLAHQQLGRSFAILKNIEMINDNTDTRNKIKKHRTQGYYGSINDNPTGIDLYLKVLNNYK